jgi:hypothetical protein
MWAIDRGAAGVLMGVIDGEAFYGLRDVVHLELTHESARGGVG